MSAAGPEFEMAALCSLALCSTLFVFVDKYDMDPQNSRRIHTWIGLFSALLLSFRIDWMHVIRFTLAIVGIPATLNIVSYVFEQQTVPKKRL